MLFRHADGRVVDFRGRLSYSWPRDACQATINKGDAVYDPQFAYGYGLTYAAAHADLGKLAEPAAPQRCGPPAAAATDDLMVFRQAAGEGYRLELGSNSDWQLPLVDDLDAVAATRDGRIRAEVSQVNVQQDARRVTWAGDGQFSAWSPRGHDYTGYLDARGALLFDVVVEQAPAGAVRAVVGCGYPCGGAVDITTALRALAPHARATLKIPLQCFADHGADFSTIQSPFAIETDMPFAASFADIRWRVGAAKDADALPCPPAQPKPVTPPS